MVLVTLAHDLAIQTNLPQGMQCFFLLLLTELLFYVKLTVFRGGHMEFRTTDTLVSIFTSVTIMALLWTLLKQMIFPLH